MTPEQIKDKYEKRIIRILRNIARAANAQGMTTTRPIEITDTEYAYNLVIAPDGKRIRHVRDEDVDVTFTVVESEERDGEENGVAFSLSINNVGGRVIGGMTPYNYTNDLWVSRDDEDAIEERFALFENADAQEAIELIGEVK